MSNFLNFISEKNCWERWRDVRLAYVWSLKPPKSGASQSSKKIYYLTDHLAFLQPYLKGGDTSGNLDVDGTAVEESTTNENDESGTLAEEEMPDEASSMQWIEETARKSLN